MKKNLLSIILVVSSIISSFAQEVQFKINSGTDNYSLQAAIERNTSSLLSELNRVQKAPDTSLQLSNVGITPQALESINMLMSSVPFRSVEDVIIERLLTTNGGYQVRNIPLEIISDDAKLSADTYQEAVIDYDGNGTITSFYFAISTNLYMQVMRSAKDVTDMRRRQLILDYVEHFRTAYNQKDIDFLTQVFSDDAIIITGKVVRSKPSDMNMWPTDKITYNVQSKAQYLTNLKRVFDVNSYINVKFSEIKISRHPSKEDFYGVLLRQGYSSTYYSDDGYVFLLWDFRDEQHPQIHVRTWQPYYQNTEKTQVIAEEEIFDISSFDL